MLLMIFAHTHSYPSIYLTISLFLSLSHSRCASWVELEWLESLRSSCAGFQYLFSTAERLTFSFLSRGYPT